MTFLIAVLAAVGADSSWIDRQFDPTRFTLLRTFPAEWSARLSPAGDHVVRYDGGKVSVVEVKPAGVIRLLGTHRGDVHDSGWSLDGRVLATTGEAGEVRVWDVRAGTLRARIASPHPGFA